MTSNTTVVIPNYNGISYLKACLESIEKQTLLPELIIVDNGSSDKSLTFLEDNYPPVKKLPDGRSLHTKIISFDENKGFCEAVNAGIKAASTKYVFLLNNDTVCKPDVVEKLEETMHHNKKAFSVQAMMVRMDNEYIIDDSGDYYNALGYAFCPGKDKLLAGISGKSRITSACAGAALYRREAFDHIGYFDPAHFCYLEDVDIGIRAGLFGYINIASPEAVVLHAGSASSGSRYNEFKQRLSAGNNIYLIYKNMPLLQLVINFPLILTGIAVKLYYFSRKGLGKAYAKGLMDGLGKIAKGRDKHIPFKKERLPYYLRFQLDLWKNLFIMR
ncbi:glycosyltransferase family 2 protein [Butyrivibrio sp. MC2013]|uniref:glycosyltransferase family 2 protein n=1 Tax=Butyrivibrio sp. MC2013 TaxID=1280686 RepID=UPI00042643BC|nr:glycosyltransferase family 2 protein [Butyrivibrio sp. MC2013]